MAILQKEIAFAMLLDSFKPIVHKTFVKCQELYLKLLKCFDFHHVVLEYRITKKQLLELYFAEMQIFVTLFKLQIGLIIREKKKTTFYSMLAFCSILDHLF